MNRPSPACAFTDRRPACRASANTCSTTSCGRTFEKLPSPEAPFVRMYGLEPEVPLEVEGLRITPVEVNHTVPAYGYLVEDQKTVAVFGGDSGPTDRIWELAAKLPGPQNRAGGGVFPQCPGRIGQRRKTSHPSHV